MINSTHHEGERIFAALCPDRCRFRRHSLLPSSPKTNDAHLVVCAPLMTTGPTNHDINSKPTKIRRCCTLRLLTLLGLPPRLPLGRTVYIPAYKQLKNEAKAAATLRGNVPQHKSWEISMYQRGFTLFGDATVRGWRTMEEREELFPYLCLLHGNKLLMKHIGY